MACSRHGLFDRLFVAALRLSPLCLIIDLSKAGLKDGTHLNEMPFLALTTTDFGAAALYLDRPAPGDGQLDPQGVRALTAAIPMDNPYCSGKLSQREETLRSLVLYGVVLPPSLHPVVHAGYTDCHVGIHGPNHLRPPSGRHSTRAPQHQCSH